MVESMKQVSENYLSTEKGYADDWAAYIASCHMTAEEALDYIRTTNTQEDRAAPPTAARAAQPTRALPTCACWSPRIMTSTERLSAPCWRSTVSSWTAP